MTPAIVLGVIAITFTAANLAWSIQSWRYAGPRMKVRALLSGTTLRVTIANGGRTANAVTHVFLGGTRSDPGLDLTEHLEVPVKVEASTPVEHDIALDEQAHSELLARVRHGFESVHVGLGSLHNVRADVLPVNRLRAGTSWMLVRRPGALRRYTPAIIAILAYTAAALPPNYGDLSRLVIAIAMVVCGVALYTTQFRRRQRFTRARIERWLTATGLIAGFILAGTGAPSDRPSPPAMSQTALLLLISLGGILAVPTAVAVVLTEVQRVRILLVQGAASLKKHLRQA